MTAIYFFLGVVGWCFLWMIWYITWIWIHITDFMWYDVVLLIDLLTDCMSFWKFFFVFWLVGRLGEFLVWFMTRLMDSLIHWLIEFALFELGCLCWLIDWNLKLKLKLKLIVWCNLIGWLIDWSVDCLIDCFIDWLMFRFWHEANFHTYFSLRVGSRKRWMYVGGNPQTSPMWFLEQLGVYQMKS